MKEITFTSQALELREAINIALSVFTLVLCFLLARYIYKEYRLYGYKESEWPMRFSIGLLILFCGEFLRAATITQVIHSEGARGTYISAVMPLVASLVLIVIGALCAIRVMTPEKWGHKVWLGSAIAACICLLISRSI